MNCGQSIAGLTDLLYMFQNLKSAAAAAAAVTDADNRQQPEVINVTFNKVNNSLGLSIVAAKVQHISLSDCLH